MGINLVEDYAVRTARQAVRDSLQAHGEQCIVLAMYHRFYDSDQPMCPYCTDDIYTDSGEICTICWGTTLQGGVKEAAKVWGMFTDNVEGEVYRKRGVWQADNREFQTEALPLLLQHDYVVRIRKWNPDGSPAEVEGFWAVKDVTRDSLRTGSRFAQTTADVIGQKAQVSELSDTHSIARYPVVGVQFPSAQPPIPPSLTMPPSPNQVAKVTSSRSVNAYTIGDGDSTTITIDHYLGTNNIVVQLYDAASGEQLDTNIEASTLSSVTLHFQEPPPPDSLKVVIVA